MKLNKFSNLKIFDQLGSTNSYLMNNDDHYEDFTVIVAREQTAGKGRLNRVWTTKKNCSINASFLIKNIEDSALALKLTFLFSLAVRDFLAKFVSAEDIFLKWPNDLLVNKKKICGILSEFKAGTVVVGVGINLFKFIADIEKPYTSLEEVTNQKLENFDYYLESFIGSVNKIMTKYSNKINLILPDWFLQSKNKNKFIRVRNISKNNDEKIIYGKIIGIDQLGSLLIEQENGEVETLITGDIKYDD